MAIYLDKTLIPDPDHIPSDVLAYVVRVHNARLGRLETLHRYYTGRQPVRSRVDGAAPVSVPYAHYITTSLTGMYLGEPIKYDTITPPAHDDDVLSPGAIHASIAPDGTLSRHTWKQPAVDISPVLDLYNHQSISEEDAEIGRFLSEYGEAYELEYADENAEPHTKAIDPRYCEMIRDDTMDHKKIAFLMIDRVERISGIPFYRVYVYTANSVATYKSDTANATDCNFVAEPGSEQPHFFGEVPAVEYHSGAGNDSLGDFETVTSLIDAVCTLATDRVEDKEKFVDSFLALYGADLTPEQIDEFKQEKMIGLPESARAEYISKQLDEASTQVLIDYLVKEIHKQSMTVDMTDEAFGTASGQALKMKLLSMTMLIKRKIRRTEKGLKKRFEMYDHFLHIKSNFPLIDKCTISPIFTVSIPIDEQSVVSIVTQLQGIVDDETLLGLLWFVKDPRSVLEKVRIQKAQEQQSYLDTFGISAKRSENIGTDDGTEEQEQDGTEQGGGDAQ